ncbi:MAG: Na+/H+ antiporter subunit E [Clostridia bacterium]|nr:Na+/H+ antiporter subunit E [Clostridia bacterium]
MALLIFMFWVVLNGRWSLEITLIGAGVTALAFVFMCAACGWSLRKEWKFYQVGPRLIMYCFTVIGEIIKANLKMCQVVYWGEADAVVRVIRTKLQTRLGKMALANAITLTPGTITLSVKGDELTIHCLRPELAEKLDDLIFEKKLLKIEEALRG